MSARDAAPLSAWEAAALAAIEQAAETGARAPTADDLQEACGCSSVSSTVHIVQRLEKRGLIRVERYQRSRRITVVATGRRTAPVTNKTPHWRSVARPSSMPSIGPTYVQSRAADTSRPDLMRDVMVAARAEGVSVQDFLADLVWAGWRARGAAIQAKSGDG